MFYLLQQYIVLAETQNYHRASEKLHISQPALSKNIKSLEKEFDGKLIERSYRGCSLTNLGLILYKHAKAVENEMQILQTEMTKARLQMKNHITIGLGTLWQMLYSSDILLAIESRNEDEQLNITTMQGSTDVIIKALLAGECDFFLGKIPEHLNEKLNGITLINTHYSIFLHKDHELNSLNHTLSVENICHYRWLIFGHRERILDYEIPHELKERIEPEIQHDTSNIMMAINLIQKSNVLTLLPHHVGEMLEGYGIIELSNHNLVFPTFNSGMIFRRDREGSPLFQMIIGVLQDIILNGSIK